MNHSDSKHLQPALHALSFHLHHYCCPSLSIQLTFWFLCGVLCVLMFSFYYKPHSPGDTVSNVAQLRHLLEQALHRPHSQCSLKSNFWGLCFFFFFIQCVLLVIIMSGLFITQRNHLLFKYDGFIITSPVLFWSLK